MKLLIINGPNLNFLGIREPSIYGDKNLETLIQWIKAETAQLDPSIHIEDFQSNYEGAIIDRLQQAYYDKVDGVVINPGAFTHYSYAILDAIHSVHIPTVEVHISDIHAREPFRQISVTKHARIQQVSGLGFNSYLEGIKVLMKHLKK